MLDNCAKCSEKRTVDRFVFLVPVLWGHESSDKIEGFIEYWIQKCNLSAVGNELFELLFLIDLKNKKISEDVCDDMEEVLDRIIQKKNKVLSVRENGKTFFSVRYWIRNERNYGKSLLHGIFYSLTPDHVKNLTLFEKASSIVDSSSREAYFTIIMDLDYDSFQPYTLQSVLSHRDDFDLMLFSRFNKLGNNHASTLRRLGSRLFTRLFNWRTKNNISDATYSLKAFKCSLSKIIIDNGGLLDTIFDGLQPYETQLVLNSILVKFAKSGHEFPAYYSGGGKSALRLKDIFMELRRIIIGFDFLRSMKDDR